MNIFVCVYISNVYSAPKPKALEFWFTVYNFLGMVGGMKFKSVHVKDPLIFQGKIY